MQIINNIVDPDVQCVFNSWPKPVMQKVMVVRQLIWDVAAQVDDNGGPVMETLKWNEPAYLRAGGSTIRLGWKDSAPDSYAVYFNCKTRLIETVRELYGDSFVYAGKRALIFHTADQIPVHELKQCILLALTYHSRKHLPLLGAV